MPTKVFVSYSHANKKWIEAGQFGLIPWLSTALERRGVEFWYDSSDLTRAPGADYRKRIEKAIKAADIAVLLVSTDYLISTFIREVEMPLIKKRLDERQLVVIPILVDHAHWKLADGFEWIKDRQMLPSEMNPLLQHTSSEVMWSDVRAEILEAFTNRLEDLQKSVPAKLSHPPGDSDSVTSLLFDKDHSLNLNLFSVNIAGLLVRATKRRNFHKRAQVSVQDLIAAIVRKGDLSRILLLSLRTEPDSLYKKLVNQKEDGPLADDDKHYLREIKQRAAKKEASRKHIEHLLRKWIARDRTDFGHGFLQVLEKAAHRATADAPQKKRWRISELDLLKSLLRTRDWQILEDCGLPAADKCRKVLNHLVNEGDIDENGGLIFRHIDKMSVNIIGNAHALAQNMGAKYISQRILLAALISYEEAYGAKRMARAGHDPQAVTKFLKETLSGHAPRTYGLTLEVCGPLLLPTIKRARKLVAKDQIITDEAFFNAFCQKAASNFKKWLKSSQIKIDLDHLLSEN